MALAGVPGPWDEVRLERAVRRFAVPDDDVAAVRRCWREVRRSVALTGWVEHVVADVIATMGDPAPGPILPPRPDGDDEAVAYLPVVALAQGLPATLDEHGCRGISESVSAATMSDVGRMLRRNRRWEGVPGLGDELAGWLTRHARATILEVERLQYERVLLGSWTGTELRRAGLGAGAGDLALNLHIPESGRPLDPGAVEESLAAARRLLRRSYPDERYSVAVCHSWLLDPRLAQVLPSSNIASFQRFFTIGPERDDDGDLSVRKFVWGDLTTPVDRLPTDSSLRRAVVERWHDGGHWHVHTGWMPWPPSR